MKKKLDAELISIAHRVLKIHNREDIVQLQKEALNLYEKLSILRFYEENFEPAKPTIGKSELEFVLDTKFSNELKQKEIFSTETIIEPTVNVDNDLESLKIEEEKNVSFEELQANGLDENEPESNVITDIQDIEIPIAKANKLDFENLQIENLKKGSEKIEGVNFIPNEVSELKNEIEVKSKEISKTQRSENDKEAFNYLSNLFSGLDESLTETKTPKQENNIKSSLENLLGQDYHELEFVKANDSNTEPKTVLNDSEDQAISEEKTKKTKKDKKTKEVITTTIFEDAFSNKTVTEIYSNTITLGLNDRIAFQMHLFNDSDQDLNRVVSQLNTMNNKNEALDFITNMVKPDYNNWIGKEEFEKRFMALVEKRFS